jgi:hypothetical protein
LRDCPNSALIVDDFPVPDSPITTTVGGRFVTSSNKARTTASFVVEEGAVFLCLDKRISVRFAVQATCLEKPAQSFQPTFPISIFPTFQGLSRAWLAGACTTAVPNVEP